MLMRGQCNVIGGDSVMAWQTSYPFCVDFNKHCPHFNFGEFTAATASKDVEVTPQRMDHVPLLNNMQSSPFPTDDELPSRILTLVKELTL
jgi:hypothetical protein